MAGLFAFAVTAAIQTAPTATPPPPPPGSDPNEKICENVTQIGSRLSKRRICATRAEWAERKLQDRRDAEYIQKGITTATCTGDKTNGISTC